MSLEIAQHKLDEYREALDAHIAGYVGKQRRRQRADYGDITAQLVEPFFGLLENGGKRIRGALTMHAYYMFGGEDAQLAVQAGRIIEMLHTYLLIIDDIADRSTIRRGQASAHVQLAALHNTLGLKGDSAQFGESQATNAALAGLHLALGDAGRLPLNDSLKLEALNTIQGAITSTIRGQMLDIYYQASRQATDTDVREVLTLKTAYYSFLQPLEFGGLLAGGDVAQQWLTDFSIHLGLGFQITDDILGTFGNSFESGKSAQDDLRDGKVTLLVSRTLQRATPSQKKLFLGILGNPLLTDQQYETAKQLIEETGALAYAQEVANNEIAEAVTALDAAPEEFRSDVLFLRGLAQYVRQRSK